MSFYRQCSLSRFGRGFFSLEAQYVKRILAIGTDIDWPFCAGKREVTGQAWQLLAVKIFADNGHKVLMYGYHAFSYWHAYCGQ
ncbi:hypothetical protein B878_09337 [Vibrio campbellii CAIM 519 = NBRC 15631 = ATCC 25920]|nr:hypothetical protein B878_09337 [Vibrio campbellii CAIM 519 = NBRC 15631 = ATCC 25920]